MSMKIPLPLRCDAKVNGPQTNPYNATSSPTAAFILRITSKIIGILPDSSVGIAQLHGIFFSAAYG